MISLIVAWAILISLGVLLVYNLGSKRESVLHRLAEGAVVVLSVALGIAALAGVGFTIGWSIRTVLGG